MYSNTGLNTNEHILVVDDNGVNVELLVSLLEDSGYNNVAGITDPREVVNYVKEFNPTLILLDIRMPFLSGFDVMQQLESFGKLKPAVIVLTAQTDSETRYKALTLGARDFLTKPFDQTEVLHRINNVLTLHCVLRERTERNYELEELVAERTWELNLLSNQDTVTGLGNRRLLINEMAERSAAGIETQVFFVAIEGISDIVKLHGYSISDSLSRELANRLQATAPPKSVIGVWNSTEWIVLVEHSNDAHLIEQSAQAIFSAFEHSADIDGQHLFVKAQIGVCGLSAEHTPQESVRMAGLATPLDTKLLWSYYQPELERALQRKLGLREALRNALSNNELFLTYQPKVDIRSNKVVGVEALLRWENDAFGRIFPDEFIPIAEASGEILAIGLWIIREACTLVTMLQAEKVVDANFSVAVNVAPIQLLHPNFALDVMQVTNEIGIDRSQLEIEVTESGLMRDIDLAMLQLEALNQAGYRIAIDDFGTGYSSLAYIKKMPISVLKIDREFIRELQHNESDRKLTSTVIAMSRHFGFWTVAEGVECEEQLQLVKEMGCDMVQGYYFSPPLKAPALRTLLQSF